jgi:transcriptional regulator with XRE-family HTH domain
VESAQAESVAENVRDAMQRKGKSQREVGEALGLRQQNVSQRLLGKVPFDVAELETLAQFLGVPFTSLIRRRAA